MQQTVTPAGLGHIAVLGLWQPWGIWRVLRQLLFARWHDSTSVFIQQKQLTWYSQPANCSVSSASSQRAGGWLAGPAWAGERWGAAELESWALTESTHREWIGQGIPVCSLSKVVFGNNQKVWGKRRDQSIQSDHVEKEVLRGAKNRYKELLVAFQKSQHGNPLLSTLGFYKVWLKTTVKIKTF